MAAATRYPSTLTRYGSIPVLSKHPDLSIAQFEYRARVPLHTHTNQFEDADTWRLIDPDNWDEIVSRQGIRVSLTEMIDGKRNYINPDYYFWGHQVKCSRKETLTLMV